jgi:hypothetical protein
MQKTQPIRKSIRVVTHQLHHVIGGVDTLDGGDYLYDGTSDPALKDLRDNLSNVDKIRSFENR